MTLVVRAVFWVFAYLGAVLSPLVFAAIGASQPDHGFWTNFSVALGFVGLAMMGLEFVLVARFRPLAAPFGQDALLQFHRQIGYAGLVFVLVHFAISAHWTELTLTNALHAPLLVWFGMAALLSVVVLIASSVWRRRLRLSYEAWHVTHTVLALVLVVGALGHVLFVDEYVSSVWKQILWTLSSTAFVALIVWVRLIKPRRALARPWRLERVKPERGETTTLALRPPANAEFRFDPGQFGWFAIGRSPFSLTQHPSRSRRVPSATRSSSRSRRWATSPPASASSSPARRSTSTARTASSRWIRTRGRASASSPAASASPA